MKRKPLKYEEQRWLVQFHTHQDHFQDMMYQPHYVSPPEAATAAPAVMEETTKTEDDGALNEVPKETTTQVSAANPAGPASSTSVSTAGVGVASQQPVANQPQVSGAVRPPLSNAVPPTQAGQQGQFTINPPMVQRPTMGHMMTGAGRGMVPVRPGMVGGGMPVNRMMQHGVPGMTQNPLTAQDRRTTLERIRMNHLQQQQQHVRTQYATGPGGMVMGNPPPNYPSPMNTMNPVGVGHDASQLNLQQQIMYQRHQQMQQRRLMAVRVQQQQQLQQRQRAIMQAQAAAAGYPQQQQYAMRPAPMQANPPMPMQQVMQPPQQPQYVQQTPGGMMMRAPRPPGQQMAYQPGMNPNMTQQPPMYR